MVRYSKQKAPSPETQDEAQKIARATQQPGQTKEQTRLIAKGIQRGIDEYKKQHKAKSRELNKRVKQVKAQGQTADAEEQPQETESPGRPALLPWILLVLSWVLFAGFVMLKP
ncbi:hypothetical protein A8C75_13685 [Marinobacterium aestuarii]|uniref:DUF2956 domain-containing protein n=1 Tax=Marinobacterium aestuarii TaxID=1821621 RepID=A0A1A9EZU9_9GAMM|nr:DUF2956 domain-containing protein [Marinobacterium aestuarii]ANG63417.1 hypothetical protein A8C75_13685 [Marinobacterium aestuarii]